jgi:hypothetical protein
MCLQRKQTGIGRMQAVLPGCAKRSENSRPEYGQTFSSAANAANIRSKMKEETYNEQA